MKKCNGQCKLEKNLCDFAKNNNSKDGHSYRCKVCVVLTAKEKRIKNKKNMYKICKMCGVQIQSDRTKAYCSTKCNSIAYHQNNKTEANIKARKHYYDNKFIYYASAAKRRAKKLNATIGSFNEELKEIYKNCPKGHHVDHIVPLQGKGVTGLHVPWNLQYLTPEDNLRKSNIFDGTSENSSWKRN